MAKNKQPVELMVRDPHNAPDLVLRRLQASLLPGQELDIVAINMLTGEYVLAKSMQEALGLFNTRWPGYPSYVCRADGGPAGRL